MICLHQALTSTLAALGSAEDTGSADCRLTQCQSPELSTDLLADESLEGGGVRVANVVIIQEGEGLLQELPLLL